LSGINRLRPPQWGGALNGFCVELGRGAGTESQIITQGAQRTPNQCRCQCPTRKLSELGVGDPERRGGETSAWPWTRFYGSPAPHPAVRGALVPSMTASGRPNSDDAYLGDGLYASFDGYSLWLRAPRYLTHDVKRSSLRCAMCGLLPRFARSPPRSRNQSGLVLARTIGFLRLLFTAGSILS